MKLLMLILFFPFSFEGENGRELLDTALEKCSRLESLEKDLKELEDSLTYKSPSMTLDFDNIFSCITIRCTH